MKQIALVIFVGCFALVSQAGRQDWFSLQAERSVTKLMANIEHPDVTSGAVIASPSKEAPNYFYHWTRDAGLVMTQVVRLYGESRVPATKQRFLDAITGFVQFSRMNQLSPALTGFGEPKFHVDGTPFSGPWARPQNDGPALRAVALIDFAKILLAEGQEQWVRENLYDGKIPTRTVIKDDLEYVSHRWQQKNFDVWEEIEGDHFYTWMVQRKALLDGAELALTLGDTGAAAWYRQQAQLISNNLQQFNRAPEGFIGATLHRSGGLDYKHSNLDSVVVLAYLHGETQDGFARFTNPLFMETVERLAQTFGNLYSVNRRHPSMAPAIGRYPEDLYAGNDFNGGNPWVLLTMAFAEAHYKMANEFKMQGFSARAAAHIRKGDAFVERVRFHTPDDGSMAEQIQRETGELMSASDLTWNYVSVLSAFEARRKALSR